MPNAATHDLIGIVTAPIVAVGAYSLTLGSSDTPGLCAIAAGGAHIAATIWLSPDLDTNSAIARRWGPLGVLWLPYKWFVPHRSWLSHSGISGLFRCIYLYLIALLASLLYPPILSYLHEFIANSPGIVVLALLGAVTADIAHVTADKLVTRAKRTFRPRYPRPRRKQDRQDGPEPWL